MGEIYSIRLLAQKRQEGPVYDAQWIAEDGPQSAPFELKLPMTEEDSADLRWYLEKFRGFLGPGTRVVVEQIERRLEELGRQLFEACFGGSEGTHVYRNLLDAAKAGRPVLLTLGSNESSFLQQPWELMRDHRGPLVFHDLSIRRQLVGAKPAPARPMSFGLPLRLLLIVARPNGVGFLDPRSSMASLLDALELLPPGSVELTFCQPPTLAKLEQLLSAARRENKPLHIVHFDGHGGFDPTTGVGVLAFEQADLTVDPVTGRRLGDLLASLDIPLVILEACKTSDLSDAPVFGSLAPALLESGVGSVVAFSHSVHVDASQILVESFYRALVAGKAVGPALSKARAALQAEPKRRKHLGRHATTFERQDWFIPQLYQVGADPAILAKSWKPAKTAAPPPRPEERMSGFPPKPMYRFHGRARDLLEIERAFESHRAVLLAGGGGMGKTALAREAAFWWLRQGRFDQAIFVSFERPTTVERVVQELGRVFEGISFTSRSSEEQHRIAVELFREKRVLLVWDNFESTLPQFQPGEAGGPVAYPDEERLRLRHFYEELKKSQGEGRLLVTCRPAESGLPGIKERSLWGLDRLDSLQLLHAIADLKAIDLERDGFSEAEIDKLLDLLGDHPLSFSLVLPHLKSLKPEEICADFGSLVESFKDDSADFERNRSLLASLAFSTSRLSKAAREVLPYFAWFQGGAFEPYILEFTQLSSEVWSVILAELEATALLRVEALAAFNVPFLRFHPTLPYAVRRQEVAEVEAAEQRFIAAYLMVGQEVHAALRGNVAAAGMALMEREEVNFRSALELAFRRGERQLGGLLANALGLYLQMAARLRERDVLFDWLRTQVPEGSPLDAATWAAICEQGFSLVGRGRAKEAVALLQQLISRLKGEGLAGGEECAFQLGSSCLTLGRIFVLAGRPDLALEPSIEAIGILEKLPGEAAQGNLALALGDLANAYGALGRLAEALAAAERGLAIDRQSGREQSVAGGLDRIGEILCAQQRWAEAEASYREALDLARRIGDLNLQGYLLQHHGTLNLDRSEPARAAELYEQAILHFQQAGNAVGELRTCNQLATAELKRGQLDVADAWYQRSRELATELKDQFLLGVIVHNVGILYQTRAEQDTDAESRTIWLRQALASIQESLKIWLERKDQVHARASYFQLGVLHRKLGDLEAAEKSAKCSLEIAEALDQPDVYKDYDNFAEIAATRGDAAVAMKWAAKRDAKLAELEKLRDGQLARAATS